ncbi:MAG: Putative Holliday junction resolvase YggF, partial [uncultured Solirubrobacteraceae bacterium]
CASWRSTTAPRAVAARSAIRPAPWPPRSSRSSGRPLARASTGSSGSCASAGSSAWSSACRWDSRATTPTRPASAATSPNASVQAWVTGSWSTCTTSASPPRSPHVRARPTPPRTPGRPPCCSRTISPATATRCTD